MSADPIELSEKVRSSLSGLEGDALVIAINSLRETIHEFSPFKNEPVDFVRWVKSDLVHVNEPKQRSAA
jgi:hypothetical protein